MNDSVIKTIGVAFIICLVSSLVVSFTAVSLRDLQNENATNNQSKKILQAANLYNPNEDVKTQFERLEQKFVDFNTGKIIDTYNEFDINEYDQISPTRDTSLSTILTSSEDIAIIKTRDHVVKFFLVRNDDIFTH